MTDEEMDKWLDRITQTRLAIVEKIGPWKRGHGSQGTVDCPVCKTGKVSFTRSSYNGHIHARCSTENCVSWME